MAAPASPMLSASQISRLAEVGEERTAAAGDVLYTIGDRSYPLIAIREGEAAILDRAGNEIVRHGPGGFLGELNLLSGQTVFVTAIAMQPLRYVAVEREALRALLFEDGPLSDLLLSSFIARREALQTVHGIGLEIVGPHSSEATMRMLDFARSNRLPFTWQNAAGEVVRFELYYDVELNERALAWNRSGGTYHDGVDRGDTAGGYPQAPILVADGKFDSGTVVPRFERDSADLPPVLRDIVLEKMRAHLLARYRLKVGRDRVRREPWQKRRKAKAAPEN